MPPARTHILVVEDDVDHTVLIMRALEEHGITNSVARVADGEAAIDYLERRNEYEVPGAAVRPSLVLLDLNLPKYSGLEVLRHIKTSPSLSVIPVVILTTSDAETDRLRAYDEHANAYVTKPVDFDRFNTMIRDLGQFWAKWNVAGSDPVMERVKP